MRTRRYARRNKAQRGDKNMILRRDDSIESIGALSRSSWLAPRVDETNDSVLTFIDVLAKRNTDGTLGQRPLCIYLPTYLSWFSESSEGCEACIMHRGYARAWTASGPIITDVSMYAKEWNVPLPSPFPVHFNLDWWPIYGIFDEFDNVWEHSTRVFLVQSSHSCYEHRYICVKN